MRTSFIHKENRTFQSVIGIFLVCAVSALCYFLSSVIGYKIVALLLLFTVSLIAMFFDIVPVLIAALLSALIWNYFFIPPKFTFSIRNPEDALMFLMYFVIATVNAVLTYKIRKAEKETMKQEEKERTLNLYNTFLNSLSHELRTPISTIIVATDNFQNSKNKLNEEQAEVLVKEIGSAALRLNQQVENLLNMSRLESGFMKPKKDWTDITELIYALVKKAEENKNGQIFKINIQTDIPFFRLDKGMLEQSLYNLLNNAAQYTPPGSTIDITAACHADMLEIIIEDNGKGFPADEIEKVFNKFYRLKHSKPGGTGLGLSIARGFIEALGGTISLENVPSGGARFTIEIPAETSYLSSIKNE